MDTNAENFPKIDERRALVFEAVQEYHAAGFSQREIARILRIGRRKVADYINGEMESLCQKEFHSRMDKYHDYIVKSLTSGMSRKDVYNSAIRQGYTGQPSTAYEYMNKIIKHYGIEISVYKSTSADAIQKRRALQEYDYITRAGLFRYLWMNAAIPPAHKAYLFKTYPQLYELDICIKEFRRIFDEKMMPLLYLFIDRYKKSEFKALSSFATGMDKDICAIENAVASSLSNGFVEGTVSKLKMIKRVMYGRCSRELLSAKMMYHANVT